MTFCGVFPSEHLPAVFDGDGDIVHFIAEVEEFREEGAFALCAELVAELVLDTLVSGVGNPLASQACQCFPQLFLPDKIDHFLMRIGNWLANSDASSTRSSTSS